MTGSRGGDHLREMMAWDFDPGPLPPSYHPDRSPSDLNIHYKDLFDNGGEPVAKHGDKGTPNYPHSPSPARTALLNTLFPDGAPLTYRLPWKAMPRRGPGGSTFDADKVRAALSTPPVLSLIDPTSPDLYATQGSVTRQGVAHYLDPDAPVYGSTSRLNKYPTVYVRRDGRKLILSGHHRLTADHLANRVSTVRLVHEDESVVVAKHGDKGSPGYHLLHPNSRTSKRPAAPPYVNQTWYNTTTAVHAATTSDENLAYISTSLASTAEDYTTFTRVSPQALSAILNDGRFKSQHETGGSGGMYNPRSREIAEYLLHGTDIANGDAPTIFGYLSQSEYGGVENGYSGDPVYQYGSIVVQFKAEIRDRTTFTLGDSLDQSGVFPVGRKISDPYGPLPAMDADVARFSSMVSMSPVPLNAPTHHAVPKYNLLDDLDTFENVSEPYPEAQYHGGVDLSDIEKVIIRAGDGDPDTYRLLIANGVEFQVIQRIDSTDPYATDFEDVTARTLELLAEGGVESTESKIARVKGWVIPTRQGPGDPLNLPPGRYEWMVISKTFIPSTSHGGVYEFRVEALDEDGDQVYLGLLSLDSATAKPVVTGTPQLPYGKDAEDDLLRRVRAAINP